MDLKEVLNSNEQSENIKVHKKPDKPDKPVYPNINKSNTNNNYSNKNEIDELLEKEKQNIYHKSWNKLDNSCKNNLFKKYVSLEKEKNNLDEKGTLLLTNLLIKNIKKLNKAAEVNYNNETCEIIKINNLLYNEEDKSYSLNIIEKKSQKSAGTKHSKSKLDKFLKY